MGWGGHCRGRVSARPPSWRGAGGPPWRAAPRACSPADSAGRTRTGTHTCNTRRRIIITLLLNESVLWSYDECVHWFTKLWSEFMKYFLCCVRGRHTGQSGHSGQAFIIICTAVREVRTSSNLLQPQHRPKVSSEFSFKAVIQKPSLNNLSTCEQQ